MEAEYLLYDGVKEEVSAFNTDKGESRPGQQRANGDCALIVFASVMEKIYKRKLPDDALLSKYANSGAYTDCYTMDLPHAVSLGDYVAAFYTSRLFKLERFVLSIATGKKSTDVHAKELALGQTSAFSAWTVEGRESNQLLLRDLLGRTRSWLMVEALDSEGKISTRLYFGSAVVPLSRPAGRKPSFGFVFHLLSGFHNLYSRALMRSAKANLLRTASA